MKCCFSTHMPRNASRSLVEALDLERRRIDGDSLSSVGSRITEPCDVALEGKSVELSPLSFVERNASRLQQIHPDFQSQVEDKVSHILSASEDQLRTSGVSVLKLRNVNRRISDLANAFGLERKSSRERQSDELRSSGETISSAIGRRATS